MKIAVAFLNKKKKNKLERIINNNILKKEKTSLSDYFNSNKIKKEDNKEKIFVKNFIRNIKDNNTERKKYSLNENKSSIDINKSIFLNIFIVFIILLIYIKFNGISSKNFALATNFRQAEDSNISLSSIYKLYGIYNDKNYIIADNGKIENKENDNSNNEDQSYVEYNGRNVYEVLDSISDNKKDRGVVNNLSVQITENSANIQRISVGNIKILNYSSIREINFDKILNENVTLTKSSDKILLYSTHTSESYTNSENFKFEYSSTMRSQDPNYNMLAIGRELSNNLKEKGISSIHNTTPHDYGAYTGAYSKSRITVKNAIQNMGGAGISIDVHRDAIADLTYAPRVNIRGIDVAQCMFVMGVGSDTTDNPYYEDNLKLAIKMQTIAEEIYPGLFKPMILRDSVYNQDLNKYSMLIEIGATGNTIDEAMNTTRCLANLFNIVYKD